MISTCISLHVLPPPHKHAQTYTMHTTLSQILNVDPDLFIYLFIFIHKIL